MLDNNAFQLQRLLENQYNLLDKEWAKKYYNTNLKNLLKNNFLNYFSKNFDIDLYSSYDFTFYFFNNYLDKNIDKNFQKLIGYNKIISINGSIQEFLGFYIEILDKDRNILYSGYMIIYQDKKKNKLSLYCPKKGNVIRTQRLNNNEITLIKKDNINKINFFKISKDLYKYFFKNENNYIEDLKELFEVIDILLNDNYCELTKDYYEKCKNKSNEELMKILDSIKLLANNNDINNLINNFYEKYIIKAY